MTFHLFQVLPIINLMANSNSHFAKLRDFITLQLPAGFPVKIEIPLFHVLKARVTFNNVNGSEACPVGIVPLQDANNDSSTDMSSSQGAASASSGAKKTRCMIDKSLFDIHRNYRDLSTDVPMYRADTSALGRDEEDDLLQLAIQQSLMETNGSDPGALMATQTFPWLESHENDEELERVLRESLSLSLNPQDSSPGSDTTTRLPPVGQQMALHDGFRGGSDEEQLRLAMMLSVQENEDRDRRAREEDEELQRVLAMSMTEQ